MTPFEIRNSLRMIQIEITGQGDLQEVAKALSLTAHQLRQLSGLGLKQGIVLENGPVTVKVKSLGE